MVIFLAPITGVSWPGVIFNLIFGWGGSWITAFASLSSFSKHFYAVIVNHTASPRGGRAPSYLELCCEGVDLTSLFVVEVGVGPEKARLVLQCCPVLEVADAGCGLAAVDALDELLEALQGEWRGDDGKIIFIRTGWKVDEIEEVRVPDVVSFQ
jgi:hypothetical protein